MSASDYLENRIGDHILRSATFAKPVTVYIALLVLASSDAGVPFTEVTGGSYARAAYSCGDAFWTATQGGTSGASSGTGGLFSNVSDIVFPSPTADWGVPAGFAVMDAASGGNILFHGTLYNPSAVDPETLEALLPEPILAGGPAPRILANALTVQVS